MTTKHILKNQITERAHNMSYGSGGGSSGGGSGGGGASTGASTTSAATSERPGQKTNLPLRDPDISFDQRVQDYFNNYFTTPANLTAQEYDVAKSFFVNRTGNEQAAAALTAAVILAANELNVKVVDIIEEFRNTGDLKSAIPTFLNLSRRSSSLLGYEANIEPNENIARQVEA